MYGQGIRGIMKEDPCSGLVGPRAAFGSIVMTKRLQNVREALARQGLEDAWYS